MRRYLLAIALLATPAIAQEGPSFLERILGTDAAANDAEQGTLLESLIEDSLSDAGRAVKVTGFRGALSGQATLESLTISDAEGTWLTLTDATLDWSRAALFAGRLEVKELSAKEILLPRLAAPSVPDAPSPEASGFQLPDLPVSVNIGRIAAERVELGEPVLGVAAEISLEGTLSLDGGDGAADFDLVRRDQPGTISLDAGYRNAIGDLRLDLTMSEGDGGIIATLAGLPGTPSVDFSIRGEAPISDFTADIQMATDGEERLAGQVKISDVDGTRRIAADISGDIAPVFAPEFGSFFGDALSLRTEALLFPDGRISLPVFSLQARELVLDGEIELTADRMPQRIDVTGRIAPDNGGNVTLPISGAATRIGRGNLSVQFDAANSEDWQIGFRVADFERNGRDLDELRVTGIGRISSGTPAQISGDLAFETNGLEAGQALSDAFGRDIAGKAQIAWNGGPFRIDTFDITARDLRVAGQAEIDGDTIRANADLQADRVANFSTLAGRSLSGSATLAARGEFSPLTQAFDVSASGGTINLAIDDPRADAILAGAAQLDINAARDETGLRVNLKNLESEAASVTGKADLRSGGSKISLEGILRDTSVVLPGLVGPSEIRFFGQEDDTRDWTIDTRLTAPSIQATVIGLLSNIYDLPTFQGSFDVKSSDLSDLSEIAGRSLAGSVVLSGTGGVNADLTRALIDASIQGRDISIGEAAIDPLLQGAISLDIEGARTDNRIDITRLFIDSPKLMGEITGAVTDLNETPVFEGSISANSGDISVLSALANRNLAGGIDLSADGRVNANLSEAQVKVTARGRDLVTGDARFDPLLTGIVDLTVDGARSGDRLDIADLTVSGSALTGQLAGIVTDLSGTPTIEGSVAANSSDISVFSNLAGRALSGQVNLTAQGGASTDLSDVVIDANASGQDLSVGIPDADRLLSGPVTFRVDAERRENRIGLTELSFESTGLTINTSGQLGADGDRLAVKARLADISPFVAGFSGALSVDGDLGVRNDTLVLDVDAIGPGGATAALSGTVAQDFSTTDLSINGSAPLALANRFIAPRSLAGTSRFNLRLAGRPALQNLSGQVTLADARLAAPTLRTSLEDISGRVDLANGRATLALDSRAESGGRIAFNGPVELTPPNTSSLNINLRDVRITDPQLYETTVNGAIDIDGPLSGGASITGALNLGETNIRIPSSSIGGTGAIPEVAHINEPPPVRSTRLKAGLIRSGSEQKSGNGAVYPLDVRISAPNRLFVRGRGLDSEFGGALRISGTTANVVPIGAFDLIRGRLDILGRRLALETARITVQGDLIPFLDIRASTDVEDTEVSVEVFGPADNPEISFTSSPELPQEEVLARLIFGRGLETLSPLQAARLALAVRTLAGQGGEGVVGNIRSGAGLADLDVTTNEDGNAAVRAGAYLGENVYSDVTVDSAGETQLNLNLDITPSLTVRGGATNAGETSLGIYFERDY